MTPDTVETRIGTLKLGDGVSTAETTQKVYDNLDFLRGVDVFLKFISATSMEGVRLGDGERGATKSNQPVIFDQLRDSNPLTDEVQNGFKRTELRRVLLQCRSG